MDNETCKNEVIKEIIVSDLPYVRGIFTSYQTPGVLKLCFVSHVPLVKLFMKHFLELLKNKHRKKLQHWKMTHENNVAQNKSYL